LKNPPPDDIKPLSKHDEERLLEAGRSVFSTSFPNPNREGCPDPEVIKAIAFRRVDPAKYRDFMVHMSRCSPCFNDFGRLREQAKRQKRLRILAVAAAVIVVVGLTAWLWSGLRRHRGGGPFEAAALDLTHRGILRGDQGNAPKPPLELARGRLELTIYLPNGNEPGIYELEVLKQAAAPVWSGEGQARIENHTNTLRLKINLSRSEPGQYFLAVRPKGWDWAYYPLVIR